MANRNRRNTPPQPTRQSRQQPTRQPRKAVQGRRRKKKKINWFRVTVILSALVICTILVLGVMQVVKSSVPTAGSTASNDVVNSQPEFFATIRPDSTDTSGVSQGETDEKEPQYTSEFDGVLFVGDSLTQQLQSYIEDGDGSTTILKDADFLTTSDYSWSALANEFSGGSGSLTLDGKTVTLVQAIEQLKARKVYIQLGKEDLIYYQEEIDLENMKTALKKLREACPKVEIVVQSVTPLTLWSYYADLDNSTVELLNTEMKKFCTENKGFKFLDVASLFKDGYLPEEYCADPDELCIHMNMAGCALWADYILNDGKPTATPVPSPGTDSNPETDGTKSDNTGSDENTETDTTDTDNTETDPTEDDGTQEENGEDDSDA